MELVARVPATASRTSVRPSIAKLANAARRQAAVGTELLRRGDLSLTQSASVRPATAKEDQGLFDQIVEFEATTLGKTADNEMEMDSVLIRLFDNWFLEGEGLSIGQKSLAALIYFRPHFGRGAGCRLVGARQALRGWRRLDPPVSRLPLPWAIVAMISNHLCLQNQYESALICLLCFFTYFRPSEPFKLLGKHIIPPVLLAGPGHQYWAITLHPYELAQPSKTQEFDESVLLDRPESWFLGPLLHRQAWHMGLENPLFRTSQLQLGAAWRAACASLQLSDGGLCPTPYQLRHAGASWEFAAGHRNLAEVQRRGRWRATASVRRYEKGGRLTEQLNKLKPQMRAHAIACGDAIVNVVCGLRLPLTAP